MPFVRATARQQPAEVQDLEERLFAEMGPAPANDPTAPYVYAEPPGNVPITRLFVIWDDWGSLTQQERSELIMKAYERAKGQADALRIAIAMGLTKAEAERMGISPPPA